MYGQPYISQCKILDKTHLSTLGLEAFVSKV